MFCGQVDGWRQRRKPARGYKYSIDCQPTGVEGFTFTAAVVSSSIQMFSYFGNSVVNDLKKSDMLPHDPLTLERSQGSRRNQVQRN